MSRTPFSESRARSEAAVATVALLCAALIASTTRAQQPSPESESEPESDPESYGASARVARAEFDSVRSEAHVDREERDRAAAGNVGDALELADGVVVQRTSSASAAPIVRGLTGYRVLLLADELRLNDSLTRPGGSALLNLVDPESVERIEVVRGPASVLYGSDALGGVVRVVTQRTAARAGGGREAGATAYARGGSAERAVRAQAAVHGADGGLGARVSFGVGHAGELMRGGGLGAQPFTGYDDWSLASRLEVEPARGHRLSLAHQSGHLLDAPRTDVSTPEDRQITERLDRESAVLAYAGNLSSLDVRLRAYAGMSLRREWRRREREMEMEQSDERDRVLGYHAGLSVTTAPLPLASLEVGAEMVLEDIGSGSATTDASGAITRERGRYVDGSRYDMYALYALWSQGLSAEWTALAGARGTLVDARAPIDPLFDPAIGAARQLDRTLPGAVASLGVRWDATAALSWSASLLGGYRAPNLEDFQALGGGARGFTVPNPELDEERSWTLETGVKLDDAQWLASAYVFASRLTGLIERVPSSWGGMTEIDGARVQTPENASRSVLLGTELVLLRRFVYGLYGGVSAYATWGETVRPDAEGAEVTEPASKVPPPTGALQLGFSPDDAPYWAQALLLFALPQPRLSESDKNDVRICEEGPEGCDEEPGWTDLTLRAGVRFVPHVTVAVGVENLLDTGYKTFASGAYAPGRNFTLAVRGSI